MTRSNKAIALLVMLLAATSFSLGVPGLIYAAELASVPGPLRWLVPVMLDAGLVVFALAAVRLRAAGKPGLFPWTWMGTLTVASMGLQVVHVAAMSDGAGASEVWVGSALAASFPLITFAASHVAISLTVGAPVTKKARRAAATASTTRPTTTAAKAVAALEVPAVAPEPESARPAARPAAPRAPRNGQPKAPDERLARARELLDAGESYAWVANELAWPKSSLMRAVAAAKVANEAADPDVAVGRPVHLVA